MLKIVRVQLTPQGTLEKLTTPIAVVSCDERDCGAYISLQFPFANAREGHVQLLPALAQNGWLIDLDMHRCPGHAKELLAAQSLIQIAKAMPHVIDVNPDRKVQ